MNAIDLVYQYIHDNTDVEGCRLEAYRDNLSSSRPWTVGYGCTGKDIVEGTIWTQERANAELRKRISHAHDAALNLSPVLARESEYRQAAITDFVFNFGEGAYENSTLRHAVNSRNWPEAIEQIKRWNRAGGVVQPGLVKRRQHEAEWLK